MTNPPLPGVFGTLAPLLQHYGYLAVAVLLFLENVGLPIAPGETILIAGAVYAGSGRLNIVTLCVIGVATSIAGSAVGYAIGRFGGRALVLRYGRYVFLTSERLAKAEAFFARRGAPVVTVSRFLEGLRQAFSIIAGVSGMPWLRFLAFSSLGAVLWIGVWAAIGDLAGTHIGVIYQQVTRYLLYVLIAAGAVVAALVTWYVLHRRRRSRPSAPGESAPGEP